LRYSGKMLVHFPRLSFKLYIGNMLMRADGTKIAASEQ
jgi:hypothetical protein